MPTYQDVVSSLDYLDQALYGALGVHIVQGGSYLCPFHQDHSPSMRISSWGKKLTYKCWSCGAGGDVFDALAYFNKLDRNIIIKEVCPEEASRRKPKFRKSGQDLIKSVAVPKRVDSILSHITEIHEDLLNPDIDEQDVNKVFQKEAIYWRGLDIKVCLDLGIAFSHSLTIKPKDFGYRWLIPVTDAHGKVEGIKTHRDHVNEGEQKAGWLPVGTIQNGKRKNGYSTFFPAPEKYDTVVLTPPEERDDGNPMTWTRFVPSERPLVLCPGELKAAAVIRAGYDAVAVTAGEGITWKTVHKKRLAKRDVIINYDDDRAGLVFRDNAIAALAPFVSKLRAFTFGKKPLNVKGKEPKLDANDISKEFGPSGLRDRLEALVAMSERYETKPIDLVEERKRLKSEIGEAMKFPGITVFTSPLGMGKSTAVRENADQIEKKIAIVTPNHDLAKEFEVLEGSLRLVSPEQATEEGRVSCPSLDLIGALRENGLPYVQRVCKKCPLKDSCPSWTQKEKIEDSKVLILQYPHLKSVETSKYFDDRIIIIDECPIGNALKWRIEVSPEKLETFSNLLRIFPKLSMGTNHTLGARYVLSLVESLLALSPGTSLIPDAAGMSYLTPKFFAAWREFLIEHASEDCANLMPEISYAIKEQQFIRREKGMPGHKEFWLIQSAIPKETPVLILDATADKKAYERIFGAEVRYWPEGPTPDPVSEVIQFMEGSYPKSSLLENVLEEGSQVQVPTSAFWSILENAKGIMTAKGISEDKVGIITLKSLKPYISKVFPNILPEKILHYGKLRGMNTLKDCELVVLVGAMQLSHDELAWMTCTLNNIDATPPSILPPPDDKGKHPSKYLKVESLEGEYETDSINLGPLKTAFQITTVAEIIQGIGRGRVYESRANRQIVLVYTNIPLMPMLRVTKTTTKAAIAAELGFKIAKRTIAERIFDSMRSLAAKGDFGYSELAEKMDISESTLKQKEEYRHGVELAMMLLDMSLVRGNTDTKGSVPRIFRINFTIALKDNVVKSDGEVNVSPIKKSISLVPCFEEVI